MKRLLSIAIAAALVALPGASQSNDADSIPSEPVVRPAIRAGNATQAMMLAAGRAGERIVAVGDRGIALLSDDGGTSHRQAKSVPIDVPLTSVSFADDKRGWAVGHWGVVLHTTDGGENWSLQRSDAKQDRPLFAVHFFDGNNGVAVGLWSLVLVTENGGRTWQTIEMPIPPGATKADLNLFALFVDARGRLFAAAEKGMVLRSDDRGRSWIYLSTGYKGSFWTGLSPSDGTLLAAGLRGSLYRSTDDGRTWTQVDTQSKSSITTLGRIGGDIVGVGLDGLVLRSSDGGASFRTEVRADRVSLTAMSAATDGRLVLYSRQGVVPGASGK